MIMSFNIIKMSIQMSLLAYGKLLKTSLNNLVEHQIPIKILHHSRNKSSQCQIIHFGYNQN